MVSMAAQNRKETMFSLPRVHTSAYDAYLSGEDRKRVTVGDGKGWEEGNRTHGLQKKLYSFIYLFFFVSTQSCFLFCSG